MFLYVVRKDRTLAYSRRSPKRRQGRFLHAASSPPLLAVLAAAAAGLCRGGGGSLDAEGGRGWLCARVVDTGSWGRWRSGGREAESADLGNGGGWCGCRRRGGELCCCLVAGFGAGRHPLVALAAEAHLGSHTGRWASAGWRSWGSRGGAGGVEEEERGVAAGAVL
jgi:hypothetical protein